LSTDAEIVMAHYPLAPKHNVRYALDWLGKIYSLLLNEYEPSDIVFIGDSAGANLILSLTDRLERKPGKLIVISPACGLQDGKNRDIRKAMESEDPLLTVAMNDTIAKNWCRGVPLDSPDISPEFIDYRDFPPILMFYGSHEVFYPHVKNLIQLMKEQGAEAYFVEKPMCHDWALCSFLPEGREAMKKMSRWIVEDPSLL
jgi:acetyl esterase/lipase